MIDRSHRWRPTWKVALLAGLLALSRVPAAEAYWLPPDFAANDPRLAVAVGDSITEGFLGDGSNQDSARPYPEALRLLLQPAHPGFDVRNRGRGGETTQGGLDRLASVLATDHPGFVLIMEGTNDATFRVDPATIVANLRAMVRLAKASSSIPLLGTIPPNFRDDEQSRAIIDAVNAQLPVVAAQEDVRFVDTFSPLNNPALYGPPDLLHPNQAGYDALGAAWLPATSDAIDTSRALLGGVTVAGARLGGPPGTPHVVAGLGPGQPTGVRLFGIDNTSFGASLMPYAGFLGGVRVAACDLDDPPDGLDEIITGAGPGGGPHVQVLRLDAAGNLLGTLASFFAFSPGFLGGVFVGCGDLDGDGRPEIVVGAGAGGGPHVRAFRFDPLAPGGVVDAGVSFFAYPAGFTGGVHVAVGRLHGPTGGAELITGAGPGGGAHVRVFRYAPATPGGVDDFGVSFFAYSPGFTGGVYVAAGDLNGDGRAELITGAGPGGGPHVRIFQAAAGALPTELAGFYAYNPGFRGGVFVGVAGSEVVTGAGPGGGPHVRSFTGAGLPAGVSVFAY